MKYQEDVKIAHKNPSTFFRQQNIWFRDNDLILQARLFEPETKQLKGVTIWRLDKEMQPTERIDAVSGMFDGASWRFRDTVTNSFTPTASKTNLVEKELTLPLGLRISDLQVMGKFAENMGFSDLRRYCAKLQSGGYDATRYLVQMHSRLSLPFASLVMASLGIPFALRGNRSSGIAIGIGVSIAIGVVYHISNAFILSFGQAGALPPVIAAWAANIIFAASAVWLTMTVNR
jgi:lipopolysaccharide export system permease protein